MSNTTLFIGVVN